MAIKKGTNNIKSIIKGGTSEMLKCYKGSSLLWEKEIFPGYLTFSSPSSFTLKTFNTTKNWDGMLEYSTDLITWRVWGGTTTLSSANNVLYLRGTDNTYITGAQSGAPRFVLTGSDISCSGSIETLLDYVEFLAGRHPAMASNCFRWLFSGNPSLISAPKLTATTLQDYCYCYMFTGTGLTTAPAISATTLATGCCQGMFAGCESLINVPILQTTTMAEYCYDSMFYGCTSLIKPTSLSHVTTLAGHCWSSMFDGCSSLIYVPKINATYYMDRCCQYMFSDCHPDLANQKSSYYTNPIPFKIPYTGFATEDSEYAVFRMFGFATGVNCTYYTGQPLID